MTANRSNVPAPTADITIVFPDDTPPLPPAAAAELLALLLDEHQHLTSQTGEPAQEAA